MDSEKNILVTGTILFVTLSTICLSLHEKKSKGNNVLKKHKQNKLYRYLVLKFKKG